MHQSQATLQYFYPPQPQPGFYNQNGGGPSNPAGGLMPNNLQFPTPLQCQGLIRGGHSSQAAGQGLVPLMGPYNMMPSASAVMAPPSFKQEPKKRVHPIKIINPNDGNEIVVESENKNSSNNKNISPTRSNNSSARETPQLVDIDLISLRSSIEEVAQCPICLELLKPPVTQCVNGHGTCTACKGSLTKCPTCRQPYCKTEPRVLNEILQKIPKVCQYYDAGCRKPAADDHELYCEFRKVKCIFHDKDSLGYCNWEGPAHKFEFGHVYDTEHLESCSPDIDGPNTFKFRKFKDPYPEKSIYNPGSPGHKLFIFTHVKMNGNFCLYIELFPLEKPKVTTYFKLSFVSRTGEILYQYKLRASTKTTLEREVNVDDNIYCMRVPVEELEKLLDEAGDLCVNCEITSEPQ